VWPEPVRAELNNGWTAFDRDGDVGRLLVERTVLNDMHRQHLIDDAVTWLDALVPAEDDVVDRWGSLGPLEAADRMQAAYEYLVQAVFAYNHKWRPWRTREMVPLLRLAWVPADFHNRMITAAVSSGHDRTAYVARVDALRQVTADLMERLLADGFYKTDPVSEAFLRSHDEPGRAWNIDAWNAEHLQRGAARPSLNMDLSQERPAPGAEPQPPSF